MRTFFKKAQKYYLYLSLGLSLEMLFRAADKNKRNFILLDEFRIFLSKLKLRLTNNEINKIL